MSRENTRERKLQLIFGSHPKVDVFYVTSDDQAFYHENDADNHAKTLANKSVLKAERRNYLLGKAGAEAEVQSGDEAKDADSRKALAALHKELFGKAPAKNAKLETIKAKVEAEQARLAAAADDAESGKDADAGTGEGSDEEE